MNEDQESNDFKSILTINTETTSSAIAAAKTLFTCVNSSVKTPVSLLQEICMKCHIQPIYEVLAAEGQIHEPTFVFKVIVGDISAVGKGSSKKRAKHAAALSVLNEIKQRSIGTNDELADQIDSLIKLVANAESEQNEQQKSPGTNANQTSASDVTVDEIENENDYQSSNPVGELIELAQKNALRPPMFEFESDEGKSETAGNKQFVCYVTFGDCKEMGVGRAKKDAKRQAANKLLNLLNNSNSSSNAPSGANIENFKNTALFQQLNRDKRNNKTIQNPFNTFRHSDKPLIKELISHGNSAGSESIGLNDVNRSLFFNEKPEYCCQFLDDLANEQNFEVTYFKIPVISLSGQHQVLAQLTTYPSIVISGYGLTLDEAKRKAAWNALWHIKLLCSK